MFSWRVFAIAGVVFLFFSELSPACSCMPLDKTPQQVVDSGGLIFSGKVVSIHSYGFSSEVEFEVLRVFKGAASQRTAIRTPSSESACGYPFKVGESYLVFPDKGYITLCDQKTRGLDHADSYLSLLGPGNPPSFKPFDADSVFTALIFICIAFLISRTEGTKALFKERGSFFSKGRIAGFLLGFFLLSGLALLVHYGYLETRTTNWWGGGHYLAIVFLLSEIFFLTVFSLVRPVPAFFGAGLAASYALSTAIMLFLAFLFFSGLLRWAFARFNISLDYPAANLGLLSSLFLIFVLKVAFPTALQAIT